MSVGSTRYPDNCNLNVIHTLNHSTNNDIHGFPVHGIIPKFVLLPEIAKINCAHKHQYSFYMCSAGVVGAEIITKDSFYINDNIYCIPLKSMQVK